MGPGRGIAHHPPLRWGHLPSLHRQQWQSQDLNLAVSSRVCICVCVGVLWMVCMCVCVWGVMDGGDVSEEGEDTRNARMGTGSRKWEKQPDPCCRWARRTVTLTGVLKPLHPPHRGGPPGCGAAFGSASARLIPSQPQRNTTPAPGSSEQLGGTWCFTDAWPGRLGTQCWGTESRSLVQPLGTCAWPFLGSDTGPHCLHAHL